MLVDPVKKEGSRCC